jgi:hypothetical protein
VIKVCKKFILLEAYIYNSLKMAKISYIGAAIININDDDVNTEESKLISQENNKTDKNDDNNDDDTRPDPLKEDIIKYFKK